ncbi:response regulator transcription factor [Desulfocurvus vexinensis]|uniref:response regulator transcription factor n=1 Tax=Desulfocurvus vexinensis TaxID=399548 RepID=UPI00048CB914|nr:response regulator transcription factor [Desulfocurvus vexinensis]
MDDKLILVVDDDEELCGLLAEYLGPEGFVVRAVHDGATGLTEALSGRYALAILDVMLPGANGFEVLHRIREASPLPVIMLTARGDDVDRIVGLEIGADDYLAKPFLPRELVARMRAVLRRARADAPAPAQAAPLTLGDVTLVPDSRALRVRGAQVHLTDAEFSILHALLAGAGRVVPREELCRVALGREAAPEDRSLAVHVSNLRRKLSEAGAHPVIKAVRGEGYIFCRPEHADNGQGLPA